MAYNANHKGSSALVKIMCAAAFILFTVFYLYFFQADLLAMTQHVLSGGTTHYDRTIGAAIITVLLCLIQIAVARITSLSGVLHALTYFPSAVLLTLLTGVGADFDVDHSFGPWIWIAPIVLLLFAGVVVVLRNNGLTGSEHYFRNSLPRSLWVNFLILALQFLMICGGANTDELLHYRLRMENLISEGKYNEALLVGEKSLNTDKSLTMLRAYALSRTKQLGEKLFEYPLTGGSSALLPNGKDVKCLLINGEDITRNLSIRKMGAMNPKAYLAYIERGGLAMKSATDYTLCAYLLDKDLENFARELKGKYNIASPTLPKYYREALTLYTHLRSQPVIVYHNEVLDADYADFQALERQYKDRDERASFVRDTYGDTYWWYYFYHTDGRQ